MEGYDELKKVKVQAAERWVAAVNADGRSGERRYLVCRDMNEISSIVDASWWFSARHTSLENTRSTT